MVRKRATFLNSLAVKFFITAAVTEQKILSACESVLLLRKILLVWPWP